MPHTHKLTKRNQVTGEILRLDSGFPRVSERSNFLKTAEVGFTKGWAYYLGIISPYRTFHNDDEISSSLFTSLVKGVLLRKRQFLYTRVYTYTSGTVAQVVIVANICHVTAITMPHRDTAVNSSERERAYSRVLNPSCFHRPSSSS